MTKNTNLQVADNLIDSLQDCVVLLRKIKQRDE